MGVSASLLNYLFPILFYFFKTGRSAQETTSIDLLFKIQKFIKKLENFSRPRKIKFGNDGLIK